MFEHRQVCSILLSIAAILAASCGTDRGKAPESAEANNSTNHTAAGGARAETAATETPAASATTACYRVDVGRKAVLTSQTFAIDFEPFKGSCFVTSHDKEYNDPPLGSEFAIYKGGKLITTLPEQFNGAETGCWVEAVSFQDVNGDRLTDIIVVGKCNAKTEPYFENSIYINNGREFITRVEDNYPLSDFKTVSQIAEYARRMSPRAFPPTTDAANSNSQP